MVLFFWYVKNDTAESPSATEPTQQEPISKNQPNTSQVVVQNNIPTPESGFSALKTGEAYKTPAEIIAIEEKNTLPDQSFRDLSGSESDNFSLAYLPYDKKLSQIEYNIWLNKKPLSGARLKAEESLRAITKLSNEKLCQLDVFMWVPPEVDEEYTGQNLGLSFCPGSATLP